MLRKIFFLSLFLVVLGIGALGWGFYWFVVLHPGQEIAPDNIQRILGKETPVLYNDGKTRLGVFFDEAHRQYVKFDEIPKDFVNALISSEDNNFFHHYGFDPLAIIRAAVKNYQVGKVVQGGSTLTQQTAKNLFRRSDRSYKAKIKELLYALRLEYYFSKEKIFEFYANQFYVSGNGHGLGVAARYYFNKPVKDLTLIESAFIAGSVKKPNFYNPFIKKSDAAAEEARKNAMIRVRYVLDKMLESGRISKEQMNKAFAEGLSFHQGTIGYPLDYVMEMVKDAVATPEVTEALKAKDIDNLATSGLQVVTTVDEKLQQQALYSLRQELSRLDVRLRGYDWTEVQKELQATDYLGDMVVKEQAFLFGKITQIEKGAGKGTPAVRVEVDLGRNLGVGVIDETGLTGVFESLMKWKQGRWSESAIKDLPVLLSQLHVGDRVWVSVRSLSSDGQVNLELERFPLVQGGALVLQHGVIKAMAGGVENRFFNRAISAKRTMGSAFKPFVYAAALQLGWSPADLLNNTRQVFMFQGQPYFPRPDHKSPNSQVSMSWAGVHSENLASVWLLYHLCDQLSDKQFQEVAVKVGLGPQEHDGKTESYESYVARIRDRYGIIANRSVQVKAAYTHAIAGLETDFLFENRLQEYTVLKGLPYGQVDEQVLADLEAQLQDPDLTTSERGEIAQRKSLLGTGSSYQALLLRQQELTDFRREFEDVWNAGSFFVAREIQGRAQLWYDPQRNQYSFARGARSGWQQPDIAQLRVSLLQQDRAAQDRFWSEVLLDSLVSSGALDMVRKQVENESVRFAKLPAYSLEVLSSIRDFRLLVGMKYLVQFARELGVRSQLDPVLSFPLGSNVVTLFEFVRLYEGLVTGEVVTSEGQDESRDLLAIIDRIETPEGEVLYQPTRKRTYPVAPETSVEVGHILENVVKFGTGHSADNNVRLMNIDEDAKKKFSDFDLAIPLMGKTGTANNYTNASFFGYLPGVAPHGAGLVARDGYAVGVYVGYDDNKEMRRSSTRITGSEGALPTWTELVRTLLREKKYSQQIDPVEVTFSGLVIQRPALGQLNLAVDAVGGGIVLSPVAEVDVKKRTVPSITAFGDIDEQKHFVPQRQFKPYWNTGVPQSNKSDFGEQAPVGGGEN